MVVGNRKEVEVVVVVLTSQVILVTALLINLLLSINRDLPLDLLTLFRCISSLRLEVSTLRMGRHLKQRLNPFTYCKGPLKEIQPSLRLCSLYGMVL